MTRTCSFAPGAAVAVTMMMTSPAFACGQMGPVEPVQQGNFIELRGYGYGSQGGPRSLVLVWADSNATAGQAEIDAKGVFSARIRAPMTPGVYRLVAYQGLEDPAPATITVRVIDVGT